MFALVQKLALSHPEVALKFFRDGKQELMTPGDGKLASALYAVLGGTWPWDTSPSRGGEEMSVTGYVSLPPAAGGTGRISTSSSTAGTSSPNSSPPPWSGPMRTRGWWAVPRLRPPAQVKASAVDVNVHPAKTEVKFLYERKVFDGVYYAVLSALQGRTGTPPDLRPPRRPAPPGGGTPWKRGPRLRGGQVLRTPPRPPCCGRWPRNTPPGTPRRPPCPPGFPKIRGRIHRFGEKCG